MSDDSRSGERRSGTSGPERARSEERDGEGESNGIPPDALFSPDDPIVAPEGTMPQDAFFSPDDPIVNQVVEGVVTGMGGKDHNDPRIAGGLAWEIRHAANIMNALSKALKEHGIEALRLHPDTEPMDAVLRSFIAGYLVGRTDPYK